MRNMVGILPETTTAHPAQYLMMYMGRGDGTMGEIRLQRTDP